ncbi:family 43 glycosylhydrolase [Enterococcus sp. DIV0213h]|uniref:family 43 glycosylhydrolase n=1 Tax=Enterococcus sp. DIV0213h TaxID=2774669 RepID=UPI003F1F1375
MSEITNPVIPGMAPDPSIIRVKNKYYIATSTFHWHPAIQLFESDDLVNWKLIGSPLKNEAITLRGTNTPAGVWAPHLSFDDASKTYWLVYSHMKNMAGREFNADSYAIWAEDIRGPWSNPVYMTSIGFDPALFHDDDGKHYLTILEWETREGYQTPGHIVIAEYDLIVGEVIGSWHRVTQGFTTRGCAEAPQIYKHNEYYYLLIASGGTGYAHGVEIGRARSIYGPYEPHPSKEPIVTSSPRHLFSLGNPDAGQFQMFNPLSVIQKAGHGSLVHTHTDEWYLAHLMSRPLTGRLQNPLGRETGFQKMTWTKEGWLEMEEGTNIAQASFTGLEGVSSVQLQQDLYDDFTKVDYLLDFSTPYQAQCDEWVNTADNPGHLRIYGQNSLFSQWAPAIMATRAVSFNHTVQTKVIFKPKHYSETAGIGLYYDSNNWLYLHLTYSEEKDDTILTILQAKLGERIEFPYHRVDAKGDEAELKVLYRNGFASLYYRFDAENDWEKFLEELDVCYLSDEGVNGESGEIGGFSGLFDFIGAVDSHQHKSYADFVYYQVQNL